MIRVVMIALLGGAPAFAADTGDVIDGPAHVIDGDTIDVQGIRVRLNGVAAAERDEPGGSEATETMRRIVSGQTVRCSLTGETTYNRQVGTCWIDTLDIGGALIAAGRARDCPRYSSGRYAALERPDGTELPLPGYSADDFYARPRRDPGRTPRRYPAAGMSSTETSQKGVPGNVIPLEVSCNRRDCRQGRHRRVERRSIPE